MFIKFLKLSSFPLNSSRPLKGEILVGTNLTQTELTTINLAFRNRNGPPEDCAPSRSNSNAAQLKATIPFLHMWTIENFAEHRGTISWDRSPVFPILSLNTSFRPVIPSMDSICGFFPTEIANQMATTCPCGCILQ